MRSLLLALASIALIFAAANFIANPTITGFVTLDFTEPEITLNLTDTEYSIGDTLEGIIKIDFVSPFYSDSKIVATLGSLVSDSELSLLLDDLGYSADIVEGYSSASNPTSVKTIVFDSPGSTYTALKLPEDADVRNIHFAVEGDQKDSVYPVSPYIDIAGDGFKEWQYFGNFLEFKDNLIQPEGFKGTPESSAIIKDDGKFYCEVIDLPYSRDYEINAKYSLYDASSAGNMKAMILSFSGSGNVISASGGANTCDLPETASAVWNSCRITFDEPISGKHLVCITNTDRPNLQKNSFRLSTDQASSTTTYICPYFPETGQCTSVSSGHFYIGVKDAVYSDSLNKKINLADAFTQYDFVGALNDYIAGCIPEDGKCAVPLQVGSNSKGKIYLSELLVSYVSQGLDKEENNFYDVISVKPYLQSIDGVDLLASNYSLEIYLSDLDLAVPETLENNLTLSIYLDNTLEDSAKINISLESSANSTLTKIERMKSNLLSLNPQLASLLGLSQKVSSALASLDLINQRLNSLMSNESSGEDLSEINFDLNSLLSEIPRNIAEKRSISDIITVSPDDLLGFDSPESLYKVQKAYTVDGTATVLTVSYYSGLTESYTLFEKKIRGNIASAKIIELFMDDVPFDVSEAKFDSVPVIEFNKAIFSGIPSFSYVIKGENAVYLQRLKTIIFSDRLTEQVSDIPVSCGDGKCTSVEIDGEIIPLEDALVCPEDCRRKTPTNLVMILIIIVAFGIYYFNFYKGPYAFKERKQEEIFKAKADFENLRKYINGTLQKKMKKKDIEKMLLKRGWTKEQITYAYRKAKSKK